MEAIKLRLTGGYSELHLAVRAKDLAKVQRLVQKGGDDIDKVNKVCFREHHSSPLSYPPRPTSLVHALPSLPPLCAHEFLAHFCNNVGSLASPCWPRSPGWGLGFSLVLVLRVA